MATNRKGGHRTAQPDFQQKTSYRLDLTQGIRFHGTWPSLDGDFNGDGHADLLIAHDGEISVYPRHAKDKLFSKPHTQSGVFTFPFMHIVDLNGDQSDDLLFYEKRDGGKISILLNTGRWKAGVSLQGNAVLPEEELEGGKMENRVDVR